MTHRPPSSRGRAAAAEKYLRFDGHPSEIYVRTVDTPAATTAVDNLLGAQASPENPGQVTVSQPSAALTAQADATYDSAAGWGFDLTHVHGFDPDSTQTENKMNECDRGLPPGIGVPLSRPGRPG